MRVFVAGATGAIGTRLVPQLVERGHEVLGTSRSAEKGARLTGARRRTGGSRRARSRRREEGGARRAPGRDRPPGERALRHERLQALRPQLRPDQPAADGRNRRSARGRPRGGRRAVRRPELRRLAVRPGRRPGEDGGRPARPDPGAGHARDARGDPAPRAGGDGRRGHRTPLRRLLRLPRRRAARDRAQAAIPRGRRRRRNLVVRPPRGRGRRDRARRSSKARAGSTTSSTTSPRPSGSGCPHWPPRSTPSLPGTCRGGSPASSQARAASC